MQPEAQSLRSRYARLWLSCLSCFLDVLVALSTILHCLFVREVQLRYRQLAKSTRRRYIHRDYTRTIFLQVSSGSASRLLLQSGREWQSRLVVTWYCLRLQKAFSICNYVSEFQSLFISGFTTELIYAEPTGKAYAMAFPSATLLVVLIVGASLTAVTAQVSFSITRKKKGSLVVIRNRARNGSK
jgi:hypothetical protein